jgi:long-chain-alcohol oxidase
VQAAGLICSKLNSDLVMLVKLVLWLLSTRMGTFLLCGKASLCWKRRKDRWSGYGVAAFSCTARTFAEIPLKERERILLEVWSYSEKETLRRLFNAFKIFSCFCYFTKVKRNKAEKEEDDDDLFVYTEGGKSRKGQSRRESINGG